jgi:protocadherin Fat 4
VEHYILIVSASDAGDPALTATATVYVNVKDVNDNPPDIDKSIYEVNVAENVDIGTPILRIQVTDKDSGKIFVRV